MRKDVAARACEIAGRFGARLRELRLRAGLAQTRLAEACGLPQSRIAEWETGRSQPVWEYVVRLALALDVPTDHFGRESGGEPPAPLRVGRPRKGKT